MEKLNLCVVGATGLVGQTFLKILEEQMVLSQINLTLVASEQNEGCFVKIANEKYRLFTIDEVLCKNFDYVVFLTSDEISGKYAQGFVKNGATVIDNSNAFRRDENVPLVVPEINAELIKNNTKIIANPNCSTIQLVLVLDKLRKLQQIKKVIVSTYQSVSGAGKNALEDLKNGTKKVIIEEIRNNLITHIGESLESGFCKEEDKIMFESKKILNSDFNIFASTVRVPISNCHLESVYVEFENEIDVEDVKDLFSGETIVFSQKEVYATEVFGKNATYVFRFRKCNKNSILFFVLADNLRRGAGFNAFKILEECIKKSY